MMSPRQRPIDPGSDTPSELKEDEAPPDPGRHDFDANLQTEPVSVKIIPAEEGGDPVCWLDLTCPECGLFIGADPPPTCPRCDTATM